MCFFLPIRFHRYSSLGWNANFSSSLAQAKTGTGKTLAFLVPVIQNIMQNMGEKPSVTKRRSVSAQDIRGIIISPTRELAEQIAVEAEKVARGTGVIVQTAVGGTQKREKLIKLRREGCHLLIGTPGRLKDILSDPDIGVSAPRLSSFVLDEADRLLDEGFAPDIMDISKLLPDRNEVDRQTLLFSATVPREVMSMVRRIMKPDFRFVKTVREDEVPTHFRVPQKAVVLNGLENSLPAVFEIAKNYCDQLKDGSTQRPFKAIVYFNSTSEVRLATDLFYQMRRDARRNRQSNSPLSNVGVFELHSRLSQGTRTRNADYFRAAQSGILMSSDVSARGMDFPEVTHVIQCCPPRDTATYIHRLGRTGRANKSGEGWILLHPLEMRYFNSRLGDLPIEKDNTSLQTAKVDLTVEEPECDEATSGIVREMGDAMAEVPEESKQDAFKSQFGTLKSSISRPEDMVEALNKLAVHGYSLPAPPRLSAGMIGQLGLDRVRGVRSNNRPSFQDRGSRSGSFGGRMNDRRDPFRSNDRRDSFRGGFKNESPENFRPWEQRGSRSSSVRRNFDRVGDRPRRNPF